MAVITKIKENDLENFLQSVNEDLNQMIESATIDFSAVNTLLKDYYKKRMSSKVDATSKVELLVSHLQYIDIFKQRLEHLILLHQQIIESEEPNFKESFFHLHVFQSMTIQLDLFEAVSAIKNLLLELEISTEERNASADSILFNHALDVKLIIDKTITRFLVAGGDRAHLPIPPLSVAQVALLDSLYTMERERVVLSWFLKSMPHGTWAELSLHYQESIRHSSDENSEFF